MTLPHALAAVGINLIWGSMFVVATIALREFPPILFTGIRFALLVILLLPFLRVQRSLLGPLSRIGLVMGGGMYLTLYLSLALAENTASIALFSKLEVPFAILLGIILLGERIGIRRVAGITIAITGAAMIGFDPAALDDLPALAWMLASAGFSAWTVILVRQLDPVHPLSITAWVSLVATPFMLVTSGLFESGHVEALTEVSWIGWSALLYTAVFGSIISHTGMYYLVQRYPVNAVTPFFLLSPLFAVIGGVLFLDDQLTTGLITGGIMILAGVGYIYSRNREPDGDNSKPP